MSATAYPSGVRGTPVEINEAVAPLLFLKKEYNPGSGGKGKYNGGLGQVIEIKSAIDEDMDLLASFDRIKFPARGRLNGSNGKPGQVSIKGKGKLNGKGTQVIKAGDILQIHTPGGAGYAKAAGNYGAAFYPTSLAMAKGFDQIVWTDSTSHQKIEEVGTMSIAFRISDKLITPLTSDTILDGVSRKTVIQVAKDLGINVEERDITVKELVKEYNQGNLQEIFGCGTAAVIAKISSFGYKEDKFEIESVADSYADKIKESIVSIQQNLSEDPHGWRYKVED